MDTKRLVISMVVLLTFSLTWNPLWDWLAKKNNWKTQPDQQSSQVAPVVPPTTGPAASTTGPTTSGVLTAVPSALAPKGGEQSGVAIGELNYDPKGVKSDYPLGAKLTSRGAGIEAVYLNRFKWDVTIDQPYVFQKPYDATSEYATPLATRSVSLNGGPAIPLWSYDWKLVSPATQTSGPTSASYSIEVPDPAGNKVVITKSFTLHSVKQKDQGLGYEVTVGYSFSNPTTQPVKVKTTFNGPNVPVAENNRDVTNVVAGFDDAGLVIFKFEAAGGLKATPLDVKSLSKASPIWAGFSSNYFDAIVRPVDAAGKPMGIAEAKAWALHPEAKDLSAKNAVLSLEVPEISVPGNGSASFALQVFVGPKQRAVLNDDYYSKYPTGYDDTLVMSSGVCSYCTWSWLINSLVWLLNMLHLILFKDWGLAIIGLVIIVRVLLHPVTKKSQVSMSRMTKMGPEMEKLKKKYADDKKASPKRRCSFTRNRESPRCSAACRCFCRCQSGSRSGVRCKAHSRFGMLRFSGSVKRISHGSTTSRSPIG